MSLDWLERELQARREEGLFRAIPTVHHLDATSIEIDGERLINFGSNDYLGLASHPALALAAAQANDGRPTERALRWGSGASPLVTGYTVDHSALEQAIGRFEDTEAAILFSTGYAANLGTVAALAGEHDIIFSDELNHASLIDGCRLSRAKKCIYPHADVDLLRELIREHRGSSRRAFLVTDTLFSMDGDMAPLREIADLADEFDIVTIVDEAHATGVYGRSGRGLCEELGVADRIPVRIGTLSKAVGSLGGFVAGSQLLIDYLRNFARTYIYSTAMPPAIARAALKGLTIAHSMNDARKSLREKSLFLRSILTRARHSTSAGDSPIIPLYLNSPEATLRCADRLRRRGMWVPAIRPPTVPRDRSLLRISLTASHSMEQIVRLGEAIREACAMDR